MSGLLSTAGGAIGRTPCEEAETPWIGADPATGVPADAEKQVQNSARFCWAVEKRTEPVANP